MDAPATRTFSSLTPDERRELYETDPDRFHELAAAAIRKACTGSTEACTQKLLQMCARRRLRTRLATLRFRHRAGRDEVLVDLIVQVLAIRHHH